MATACFSGTPSCRRTRTFLLMKRLAFGVSLVLCVMDASPPRPSEPSLLDPGFRLGAKPSGFPVESGNGLLSRLLRPESPGPELLGRVPWIRINDLVFRHLSPPWSLHRRLLKKPPRLPESPPFSKMWVIDSMIFR